MMGTKVSKAARPARKRRPATADELHRWIVSNTGLVVPRKPICAHHDAPFDYIWAAYNDEADLVVWAPRGGGKTTLGALATLLDIVHKPGCQVRILGGSMEQSLRMWEHLQPMIEENAGALVEGKLQARSVKLSNASGVAVLSQSQTSVRGQRVQRLRCDEVELFEPEVWSAAQLVTRSRRAGESKLRARADKAIRASIEALSTMHAPYGLMQEIVDGAASAGRRVIKWCLLDVLEACVGRECAGCGLEEECRGAAKLAEGFVGIDDAIAMKRRVSRETWEAEMLCLRPSRKDCVFPQFKASKHVSDRDWWNGAAGDGLARTLAMDFGYRNPFVCLWVLSDVAGRVYVMDEYVRQGQSLHAHIEAIKARHAGFRVVCCDPAGNSTNSQTSRSDVQVLQAAGFEVHRKSTRVQDGLEAIKAALEPGLGEPKLRIHPRCQTLIRSLECYHYKPGASEAPHKDNVNDHCADALRYYYVARPPVGSDAACY